MRQSRHVVNRHMVQLENKFARYAKSQNQLHSAVKHAGDESVVMGAGQGGRASSASSFPAKNQHSRIKSEKSPKAATTMRPCRHTAIITAIITRNSPVWQRRHRRVQIFPAARLSPCKQTAQGRH